MKINVKQKIVIWVFVVTVVLMGIFPPWLAVYKRGQAPSGYRFAFTSPPKHVRFPIHRIHYSRLFLQWFLATVVAGSVVVALKDRD